LFVKASQQKQKRPLGKKEYRRELTNQIQKTPWGKKPGNLKVKDLTLNL